MRTWLRLVVAICLPLSASSPVLWPSTARSQYVVPAPKQGELETVYGKFRDETRIHTRPFNVRRAWAFGIGMRMGFTYSGRTDRGEPRSAWLILEAKGKRWLLLRRAERSLVLLLNGTERMPLEADSYTNDILSTGGVLEVVGYTLTSDDVR